MLVSAAAKRWNVDPASCHAQSGEVLHAPTGRRAKYGELAAEAARLPVPDNVALKRPEDFKLIGTPAKRLDTPQKVNGTAIYGIDVRPLGVKIATLTQSPVFGGRVKSVDDAAAKAVKGVRQIVRLDDAVAVVADHMGAAKKGLAALVIEWDDGPHAKLNTEAVASELDKATLHPGAVAQSIGDADKAIAGAVRKVEAMYQLPFLAHATMEPMNCTAHVRKDSCEVWVGSQAVARVQAAAAKITGLPLDKVVVHNHLIGGGFGRRLEADGVIRAVQIAQHVDGPVKLVWTREEDIQHDMYRPYYSDVLLAQRRAIPQRLRHRKLHRRIGGGREARCGRLSPGPPQQDPPRQGRSRACRGKGRVGTEIARTSRPRRFPAVCLRDLYGPDCRGRSGEGRCGSRSARRLCGRLRHRDQSRHRTGADRERNHLRRHRGALRRDYRQGRTCRAKQLRYLPGPADE
jgi:CO/xanthine dehydrogenase Mo-binding subunit